MRRRTGRRAPALGGWGRKTGWAGAPAAPDGPSRGRARNKLKLPGQNVARLAGERQGPPIVARAGPRHLGSVNAASARELNAIEDDELVDRRKQPEVSGIGKEV